MAKRLRNSVGALARIGDYTLYSPAGTDKACVVFWCTCNQITALGITGARSALTTTQLNALRDSLDVETSHYWAHISDLVR